MKSTRFQRTLSWAAAAAALLGLPAAHAVKFGIVPSTAAGAPPVINPFTGQQTDVWKLVGYLGCSGFQITREWVMQAGHCGIAPEATATFTNHLGSSPVLGTDCQGLPGYDFQLCRLKNPENLAAMPRYPALAALPGLVMSDATQYGSIMAYGHGSIGDGLAFVGFDGLPFGYDPATAAVPSRIPYGVGGDSGGAAYWFAPGAAEPVMVGVLVHGDLVSNSPLYFDQAALDFIKAKIVGRGDPAPVTMTGAQYYTPPAGRPAISLSRVPTVSVATSGLTLAWTAPSMTPAITSYKVTVGQPGVLERGVSVAAGTGNKLAINNLAPAKYIACVRPVNSIGPANAALATLNTPDPFNDATWYVTTATPNCITVDYRAPLTSATNLAGQSQWALLSGYKAVFTWSAPTLPTDLPIQRYRVVRNITSPTGAITTGVSEVTTLNSSINASKNSVVCANVTAITALGQVGPQTGSVCVTLK